MKLPHHIVKMQHYHRCRYFLPSSSFVVEVAADNTAPWWETPQYMDMVDFIKLLMVGPGAAGKTSMLITCVIFFQTANNGCIFVTCMKPDVVLQLHNKRVSPRVRTDGV